MRACQAGGADRDAGPTRTEPLLNYRARTLRNCGVFGVVLIGLTEALTGSPLKGFIQDPLKTECRLLAFESSQRH